MVSAVLVCALVSSPATASSSGGSGTAPPTDARVIEEFGSDGIVQLLGWTAVRSVAELPDGRLLLYVHHNVVCVIAPCFGPGAVDRVGLVRLLANGLLDASFGAGGPTPGSIELPIGTGETMMLRSNGKILFTDGFVAQYTSDGEVDQSFGDGGYIRGPFGGGSFELDDGSLMLSMGSGGFALGRYTTDGIRIPGTEVSTNLPSSRIAPVRMVDGSWRVATTGDDGSSVVALTANATLDLSFGGGDGIVEFPDATEPFRIGPRVMAAALPDGRLVVAFDDPGASISLLRLTANGDADATFGTAGRRFLPFVGDLMSIDVDDDGSMTLGVNYQSDDPKSPLLSTVVRTRPTGELDTSFRPTGWTPGSVGLAELGVVGYSFGGSLTILHDDSLVVATAQYGVFPFYLVHGVAQLTKLELPPRTRIVTVTQPARALTPAVRLMNAHQP